MTYISLLLDIILIGLLGVGIKYAAKLTRQLTEMRTARQEMEQFIGAFNATVVRAEAGVHALKLTTRTCGDDLEKQIEKGQLLRDELNFLTESADLIANRLSHTASQISRGETPAPQQQPPQATKPAPVQQQPAPKSTKPLAQEMRKMMATSNKTPSAAEQELLRALEKMG